MAGCFGNHPIDRHFESQLMKYLNDSEVVYCPTCDEEYSDGNDENEFLYDEDRNILVHLKCKTEIPL